MNSNKKVNEKTTQDKETQTVLSNQNLNQALDRIRQSINRSQRSHNQNNQKKNLQIEIGQNLQFQLIKKNDNKKSPMKKEKTNLSNINSGKVLKNNKQNETKQNNNKGPSPNIKNQKNSKSQIKVKTKSKDNKSFTRSPEKNQKNMKNIFSMIKIKQKRDLKQIQSQEIRNMVQKFQKTIQSPVQLIQKIQNSNTLQRCQVHNNIFTLYCTIDRKPLCVGCMYQTTDHKHHRVLPLNKAYQSLRQDSEAYLNKVQEIVKTTQQLIKRTNENIIIVEREYPSIIYKIQYFYSAFHQMLKQKEKQQVQRLEILKQTWKTQFQNLALQLHKINYFLTEKVNFQYKKTNDQYLLTKRCILQALCKSNKVIQQDMVIYQKGKFDAQLDNLDLVKDLINYRLTLVTPVFPNSFINKRKSLYKNEQYFQPQMPLSMQKAQKEEKKEPISKKHQSKASVKRQFSVQKKNLKGIMRGFVPLSPVGKLHKTVSFN